MTASMGSKFGRGRRHPDRVLCTGHRATRPNTDDYEKCSVCKDEWPPYLMDGKFCLGCLKKIREAGANMTEEEKEKQLRSFVHGNCSVGNEDVTRELVDEVRDGMEDEDG